MIANFVVFHLVSGTRPEFVQASLENSRGSINGEGCIATSIFTDPNRPDIAYVFEVFVDEAAFNTHHEQPYYKQWLKDTADMLAKPYELLQNNSFPGATSYEHLRIAVGSPPNPTALYDDK